MVHRITDKNFERVLPSTAFLLGPMRRFVLFERMQAAHASACNRLHNREQRLDGCL